MRKFNIRAFLVLFGVSLALIGQGCATVNTDRKTLSHRDRARFLVEVANGAILEGDAVGALQQLAKAESEYPDLPELYHSKALAYAGKHDLAAALKECRKAVELKPDYTEANNTLGKLLFDSGKPEEAQVYLKKALNDSLYRDAYKAATTLGIIKYKRGEFLQAETFFDKAIQDASDRACVAYYYRGHIHLQRSNFKDAISDYDRATRRFCAKFGEGYLALGVAYERNRQFKMARRTFLEVQKLYPNTSLADQAIGRLKKLP